MKTSDGNAAIRRRPSLQTEIVSVVIPARNEQDSIGASLDAFCRQTTTEGSPLPSGLFSVTVVANGCTDATVDRVRHFAERTGDVEIRLIEASASEVSNVGAARKLAMDAAAERFFERSRPRGILATTDADTIVASDWIHQTIVALAAVDAVAGHLRLIDDPVDPLPASFHELYALELCYRDAYTRLESLIDPVAHDPWPRHGCFAGASFAVSAQAYADAGGIPAIASLEDREFFFALRRSGARIRHSLDVRAETSARRLARVDGGFATFLASLEIRGQARQPYTVENPRSTIRKMRLRAGARAARRSLDIDHIARAALPALVPVEEAIAVLRAAARNVRYQTIAPSTKEEARVFPLL